MNIRRLSNAESWMIVVCCAMGLGDCSKPDRSDCKTSDECGSCQICEQGTCQAAVEICGDGLDNNCDGKTDEACGATCGNGRVEPGESCDGNCPSSCNDGIACTIDSLLGNPNQCNVSCNHAGVTKCQDGDGCCSAGCNTNNDNDCSATCGNGIVEQSETCDGNCPTSCDDGNRCTLDQMVGSAQNCSAACSHTLVVTCSPDDGCCPAGCNSDNDNDCSSSCGNKVVELGETCDGNCPASCDDGNSCTIDTMTGSAQNCSAACSHTLIVTCANGDGCCPAGCNANNDTDCSVSCGNQVVEYGEACDGNCPVDCNDGNGCTIDTMTGSAQNCSAVCSHTSIVDCANGDGCCPAGCNANNDSDCSASCGNNVVEHGETCDGNCVNDCNDGNNCTLDTMTGSVGNCNVACAHASIATCVHNDGCCPAGCNANNDHDCSVSCGNGAVESGETCDGNCPVGCNDGNGCTIDTMTGSAQNCNVVCSHASIVDCVHGDGCCPAGCNANNDNDCSANCGNGAVESGETCDGNCPEDCDDDNSCTIDTMTGSAQNCNAACSYAVIASCAKDDGCCPAGCNSLNDSDCSVSCGNQVVEPGEICDGNCPADCNDGNACTIDTMTGSAQNCNAICSYTNIVSCVSGDGCCPAGCNCNVDNDCRPCDPGSTCLGLGSVVGSPVVSGNTQGFGDEYLSFCGGADAEDVDYCWAAPSDGAYLIEAFGNFDLILSLYRAGIMVGCDPQQDGHSGMALRLRAGEEIVIVVDGYQAGAQGEYALNIRESQPLQCEAQLGSATGHALASGSTSGQGNDVFTNSCGGSQAEDMVYCWNAPKTGTFQIDTFGSGFDTVLSVYEGSNEVACDDDTAGLQSFVEVQATQGQTFFIVVDGYGSYSGTYQLNIKEVLPRTCDQDLGSAVGHSLAAGNTLNQGDDFFSLNCHNGAGAADVSFCWTAPSTGRYSINSGGSGFNTTVSVYRNDHEVACADIELLYNFNEGDQVVIVLDGVSPSDQGPFLLSIMAPLPIQCDGQLGSATGSPVASGSTVGQINDVFLSSCGGANAADAAYCWTAPSTGRFRFDTFGSDFDTVLAVYADVNELACNDDMGGLQSAVTLDVTQGQQLTIVVDGFGDHVGNYLLNITLPQTISCDFQLGSSIGTLVANGNTSGQSDDFFSRNCRGGAGATDVAYCWTAPSSGRYIFDVLGSDFNTLLSIYRNGTEIQCSDVALTEYFGAGDQVVIVLDGYRPEDAGNFVLSITQPEPPQCDIQLDSVVGPSAASGSTVGQGNNVFTSSCGGEQAEDVVLCWSAPNAGRYVFDTTGSDFDTVLALYEGNNEIACNDENGSGGSTSRIVIDLAHNQSLAIVVDGYSTNNGNYVLNISSP